MAEERDAADHDKLQTPGRQANAAKPLDAAEDRGGAERYPRVSKSDTVERKGGRAPTAGERRSFDRAAGPATPLEEGGDGGIPRSVNEGRLGPGGDPAEGKR